MLNGVLDVWTPAVDVKETPNELVFVAELPGMNEKNVDVELSGGILTIRGNREFENEEKGRTLSVSSVDSGTLKGRLQLIVLSNQTA